MSSLWVWNRKRFADAKFFFLINLFTVDVSVEYIVEQQFQLAKYGNISISETESMADIDRNAYYSLLVRDEKENSTI